MTDLTGIWESEVTDLATPAKHTGELNIRQTGTFVLSNSAPGWDMWHGYVEVLNGAEWLTAFGYRDSIFYTVKAQVLSNGRFLTGIWTESLERSGTYSARRKVAPAGNPTLN
jgi:hypothetical protein